MPSPPPEPHDQLIYKALRMPSSLVERIEALRASFAERAKHLAGKVTFTHVVVLALRRGLDALERERDRAKKKRSRPDNGSR